MEISFFRKFIGDILHTQAESYTTNVIILTLISMHSSASCLQCNLYNIDVNPYAVK